MLVGVLLLAVINCSVSTFAQESLIISGEMPIARLLDLAASRSKINLQYDRSVVGTATAVVRTSDGLTDSELWAAVHAALNSRGLTIVQAGSGGHLQVVRLQDASTSAGLRAASGNELFPAEGPLGFANIIFEPRRAAPTAIIDALRPMVTERSGRIALVGDSGLVMLSGPLDRLRPLEPLLDRLDSPAAIPIVTTINLDHAESAAIIEPARRLASRWFEGQASAKSGAIEAGIEPSQLIYVGPESREADWRQLISLFDRPATESRLVYPVGPFIATDLVQSLTALLDADTSGSRVIADPLSNVLIVDATPLAHAEVEAFLDRLRNLPAEERRQTIAFDVEYRGVEELRELLDEVIAGDQFIAAELDIDSSSLSGETPRSESAPLSDPFDSGPTIVTDGVGNRLLVTGTPVQLETIKRAIEMIDTPHPQVVLEVIIVSLTEGESFDLGVEIRAETNNGDNVSLLSSLFGLSGGGSGGDFGTGSGVTASTILPGEYEILLRALATVSEGRNVSRPKILVSNNQQATFQSVVQEPFTSTNASDTVATTSFGGTQDAGTTISVTPQITAGDRIRLEYSVSQSAFTGESADPSIPPPRQQNQVTSVVTVPDAHAIAVTGIVVESEGEAVSKVPFLGDIPGIGELFKARSRSNSRSRFFIFIKPDIVRSRGFEDLKYLGASDVVDAGIRDGRPVLEPRIIR